MCIRDSASADAAADRIGAAPRAAGGVAAIVGRELAEASALASSTNRPVVLFLDSLGRMHHTRAHELLVDWLADEWEDKGNAELYARQLAARRADGAGGADGAPIATPPVFSCEAIPMVGCRVPQQPNGVDCGLFVCESVSAWLEGVVSAKDYPVRAPDCPMA